MAYRRLPLASLVVNPANDRHGELENETAAIAQLFATQETHMRNLAKDLVAKGEVFEPPLVFPDGDKFVVADGNRRTTCLKLIANAPRPSADRNGLGDAQDHAGGCVGHSTQARLYRPPGRGRGASRRDEDP